LLPSACAALAAAAHLALQAGCSKEDAKQAVSGAALLLGSGTAAGQRDWDWKL